MAGAVVIRFTDLPMGKHGSWRIVVCPKCGRHGRLLGWPGGREHTITWLGNSTSRWPA
jgi:hypothetical protein